MKYLISCSTELCHLCSQAFIPDSATADGLCNRCQDELCSSRSVIAVPHVELQIPVLAATVYEGPIVQLVEAVKRRGHFRPLRFMARTIMSLALEQAEGPLYPIPASHRGKHDRGFDQMLMMARHTGRSHQSIFTRRHGMQQKQLNRRLRLHNAEKTLALHARRVPRFSTGIVIDDVLTTGATVTRAVELLREAGVTPSAVVVLATKL